MKSKFKKFLKLGNLIDLKFRHLKFNKNFKFQIDFKI